MRAPDRAPLTCADGFHLLAGDANEDANEDAASGDEIDGNGGPPRRARPPRAPRRAPGRVRAHARPAPRAGVRARGRRGRPGRRRAGFVLVDLETEKARVFGDVSQEKAFVAVAAAWVGDVVAVVVKAAPRGGARGTRERRGNARGSDWFGRSGDDDDDVDDRRRRLDDARRRRRVRSGPRAGPADVLAPRLPEVPPGRLLRAAGRAAARGAARRERARAVPARRARRGSRPGPGPVPRARGVGAGCTESAVLYEVIVTGAPRLGGGARAARCAKRAAPRSGLSERMSIRKFWTSRRFRRRRRKR